MLLIFYHVGMFFVPWEWHINNNRLYEGLELPMLFLNQWRLPILFVISGMGTAYALRKRNGYQFAAERVKRLLIPLVVGIILVVPPQVYIERLNNGEFSGNYLHFWPSHAFRGIYPEGNFSWHHLWFLPYLLAFSFVFTPLFLYFRNNPDNLFVNWIREQVKAPAGFLWFLLPLYLTQILLKPYFPETHAFVGDWYTLVNYSLLFFYGFVLITIKEIFWKTVFDNRRIFLLSGMVFFSVYLLLIIRFPDIFLADYLIPLIAVINSWSWILTLFGFAAKYLNKKSPAISYANEAVYPFYILHQTVIICLGYYLKDLGFGFWQKATLMVGGTFLISWILYEFLIRRIGILRPLFGLKSEESKSTKAEVVAEM